VIAMLAILLGVSVGVRRRAARFAGLAEEHRWRAQESYAQAEMFRQGGDQAQETSSSRLAHWHDRMWIRFLKASAQPWLPLPTARRCSCRICAVSEDRQVDEE
jgi:hypothetical protein